MDSPTVKSLHERSIRQRSRLKSVQEHVVPVFTFVGWGGAIGNLAADGTPLPPVINIGSLTIALATLAVMGSEIKRLESEDRARIDDLGQGGRQVAGEPLAAAGSLEGFEW